MDSRDEYEEFAKQFRQQLTAKEYGFACWQAGRSSMRDEAVNACKNEHLEDPQDREDDAYDNAVLDCVRSIKTIQP